MNKQNIPVHKIKGVRADEVRKIKAKAERLSNKAYIRTSHIKKGE